MEIKFTHEECGYTGPANLDDTLAMTADISHDDKIYIAFSTICPNCGKRVIFHKEVTTIV